MCGQTYIHTYIHTDTHTHKTTTVTLAALVRRGLIIAANIQVRYHYPVYIHTGNRNGIKDTNAIVNSSPLTFPIYCKSGISGSVIFSVNRETLFGREKFLVPRALPL